MIDEADGGHREPVTQAESPVGPAADERASGVGAARPVDSEDRLRQLIDAHFDFIWRSLRRLGVSRADSDDGAQRVFVVASRRLGDIEPGKERAFLFSTAYRIAREMRRASARRPEAPLEDTDLADPAPNPEQFADRREARALLDDVLDALPLESRTVFVLFEMEELSMPEIALLLDIPVGTAASRLRRARELFRTAAARVRARAEFRGGTP
jgi:RNA polymerase sigma-70 factor (ECF subfamily)